MRGKAAGEKGREIKGERERERKRGRRKRARVEAAGFLFRHRRSHPTKIDSVSLGSSVQRRATRRNLLCPSLLVHSCSGRDRRQRLSSFLSSLSRFLFFLARFSPRCRIPLSPTLFVSQERKGEKAREKADAENAGEIVRGWPEMRPIEHALMILIYRRRPDTR